MPCKCSDELFEKELVDVIDFFSLPFSMQRQARRKKSRGFYKKVPTFFQKCRDFLFHVCFLRSGRVGYPSRMPQHKSADADSDIVRESAFVGRILVFQARLDFSFIMFQETFQDRINKSGRSFCVKNGHYHNAVGF